MLFQALVDEQQQLILLARQHGNLSARRFRRNGTNPKHPYLFYFSSGGPSRETSGAQVMEQGDVERRPQRGGLAGAGQGLAGPFVAGVDGRIMAARLVEGIVPAIIVSPRDRQRRAGGIMLEALLDECDQMAILLGGEKYPAAAWAGRRGEGRLHMHHGAVEPAQRQQRRREFEVR